MGRAEGEAEQAGRLLAQLKAAGRVWLFLDYDGTLADFAPTPADVLPDAELIGLLDRLSRSPALRVVILSGRRLADLRRLTPLAGVFLAGTYGIELQTPDGDLIYALDEAEVRPALQALKPQLAALLAGRQGFYLEDKGWSLAVHARFAGSQEAGEVLGQARRLMQAAIGQGPFSLLDGERFLEIGPQSANKDIALAGACQVDDHLLDGRPQPGLGALPGALVAETPA
ncbi:MAG TPA: trehalose-phosphatase, partial [Anaerolineales bacterium]